MKMDQCVPKRRHIKFRRRGITQKKAYNSSEATYEDGTYTMYLIKYFKQKLHCCGYILKQKVFFK